MFDTASYYHSGTMAERLRREIRNLLGSPRAGSSPAGVDIFLIKPFRSRDLISLIYKHACMYKDLI
jgi:hypothetical protein